MAVVLPVVAVVVLPVVFDHQGQRAHFGWQVVALVWVAGVAVWAYCHSSFDCSLWPPQT